MAQSQQASQQILNGQNYFRIFQDLQSSGDIFEIDTSAKALAIGPQSDISRVCISYLDAQNTPTLLQNVEVSVDNPFVGRLDALLATQIPNTGVETPGAVATPTPARLLVSLGDLIENDYVPYDLSVNDEIIRAIPRIDLYSYFREPSSLAPVRSDKTFSFADLSVTGGGIDLVFIIPYYGRRFGRVIMTNQTGTTGQSFEVRGVRLAVGKTLALNSNKSAEVPLGDRRLSGNGSAELVTKAREDGQFDLLVVKLTTDQSFVDARSLRVDVSDREA